MGLDGIDANNITDQDFDLICETLFKNGLPGRGTNMNLNDHALNRGDSAFRGTTEIIGTSDGTAGATAWAGVGGFVIEIAGETPGWELKSVLGDQHPTIGEQEIAILAKVEGYKIKGIYKVKQGNRGPVKGQWTPNPHYK